MLHYENPKRKVDMVDPKWELCGTVACHAGWFAVARNKRRRINKYHCIDSSDDMAKFLGFKDRDHFRFYFYNNRKVWGNRFGNTMFFNWKAFDPDNNKPKTLETIGKHWLEVASRMEGELI